jgi:hypothetical protein
MKWIVITLAIGNLGTGLWAAWLWRASSAIEVTPTWAEAGGTEPIDQNLAREG